MSGRFIKTGTVQAAAVMLHVLQVGFDSAAPVCNIKYHTGAAYIRRFLVLCKSTKANSLFKHGHGLMHSLLNTNLLIFFLFYS